MRLRPRTHWHQELQLVEKNIVATKKRCEGVALAPTIVTTGTGSRRSPIVVSGDYVRSSTISDHFELKNALATDYPQPFPAHVELGGQTQPVNIYVRDRNWHNGPTIDMRVIVGRTTGQPFERRRPLAHIRNALVLGIAEIAIQAAGFDPAETYIDGAFYPESPPVFRNQDFGARGLNALTDKLNALGPPGYYNW